MGVGDGNLQPGEREATTSPLGHGLSRQPGTGELSLQPAEGPSCQGGVRVHDTEKGGTSLMPGLKTTKVWTVGQEACLSGAVDKHTELVRVGQT